MRTNRHHLLLTDAELDMLIAAAEITRPTAAGCNLSRAIREAAIAAARRTLTSDDGQEE